MLIQCDRHTKKDLAQWEHYESADIIHGKEVEEKLSHKSIKVIESFVKNESCYFSTSWGKDSVVAIHLAYRLLGQSLRVWNIRVLPNRNPYCDVVRDCFLERFKIEYHEVIADYSNIIKARLALSEYNRETDRVWHRAIRKIHTESGTMRHCLGVRADESNVRLLRCLRWKNNSPNGCAPLAWWKAPDVFGYLNYHDLPIHPNYAMLGGGRWDRHHLRVAEIGDSHGRGIGRDEWEKEYYSDFLRRCGYVNY
jgi:phosphoadenosine phosphosulfate reductase